MNNRDYMPPDSAKKIYNLFNQIYKTGNPIKKMNYEIIRKDGSSAFHELSASLRRDKSGRAIGFRGITHDITEIKLAEDALKQTEEGYRTLVEESFDGIFIQKGPKIIFANQPLHEMLGYEQGELLGKDHWLVYHPDYQELTRERARARMRGEKVITHYEVKIQRKDRSWFYGEIGARVISVEGETGIQVWVKDIMDRKQAEEALRSEEEKFRTLVEESPIGISLIGKDGHYRYINPKFVEIFGYSLEDIPTGREWFKEGYPDQEYRKKMQGRTSLMLMDKDSTHPDFEHLKGIEDYVKSAADLTRQLLGFARGGKYEVRPTDLNELIKKSSRMFGRTKKEITIHPKYQEGIWTVEVDQGQIEQVLMNLYINAWQAMPGGGELYLETENVTLDENYIKPYDVEPGRYVKVSVTDTGVGMDEATRQRIFEPFFTTKEMGRGTGLGLASVYGIIKNHGGFINAYSEKGEGTTFNIYLAATEAGIRGLGSVKKGCEGEKRRSF